MIEPLAERIRDYIARKGHVTMSDILELSKGRYELSDMHAALRIVHRYKDVIVRTKNGDNVYSIRTLKTYAIKDTSIVDDSWVDDFYMHCPFVSDSERACYHAGLQDKRHYRTCNESHCVQMRYMFSSREDRALMEWKREREILKTI